MASQHFIETTIFCTYHEIDNAFVNSLADHGLIELDVVDQQQYIPYNQLEPLERMVRLHRELDINIAGIEAIVNMLGRFENLQQENLALKNRLRIYITEE